MKLALHIAICLMVGGTVGSNHALAQRRGGGLELAMASKKTFDVQPAWDGRPIISSVRYHEPAGRRLVFTGQSNIFYIILRNTAPTVKRVWGGAAGAYSFISFEITDEKGVTRIMKRKRRVARSTIRTGQDLKPGEQFVLDMFINKGDWDNVPSLVPGERKTYTMRIVFDNKDGKIVSSPYTVVVDGTGIPTAPTAAPGTPAAPAAPAAPGVVVKPPASGMVVLPREL